ncbi:hypothetical protein SAMN05216215_100662 [Saccharopolyspora shandongensis]|uniref:Uncharacterized protein n=1 Tax=Saccharopolyspora shandongensis TaxID=418495 RepID=A0A1H2XEV1_9PSEU|nr:hypothetical protein [Saccharopolyspora shandongensis]SDW91452.1 hypothetical protein SAMN05216215_100662 [Saccharopolyspora shandongensis]
MSARPCRTGRSRALSDIPGKNKWAAGIPGARGAKSRPQFGAKQQNRDYHTHTDLVRALIGRRDLRQVILDSPGLTSELSAVAREINDLDRDLVDHLNTYMST